MPYFGLKKRTVKKTQYRKKTMAKSKMMTKSRAIVPSAVKSYVNRAIAIHAENKVVPFNTNTSVLDVVAIPIASQITTNPSVFNLSNVWTLSQGVGQSDRIGNSILPKKWALSLYVHNNGTNAVPALVRVIIYKLKNGFSQPFTAQPTDILQTGNTSSGGNGNFLDLARPINTDKYTLLYNKVVKVGSAGSGTNLNNDFPCFRYLKVNLLKHQKSKLKYNDSTTTPSNSGLYMSIFVANYDGSSLPAGAYAFAGPQISYDVIGEFEDA